MYSEESEDDISEYHLYRRKYYLLLERCEAIQLENERIVSRLQRVHKLLLKYRKQRSIIIKHLDQHGDNWREASFVLDLRNRHPSDTSVEKPKALKKKAEKPSRDPNAPKRPANPFFQFCQEQRTLLTDTQTKAGPQTNDPSKQEITKELAKKWNALSHDERKIYYDKYEQSKIKYKADIEEYKARSQPSTGSSTVTSTSTSAMSTSTVPTSTTNIVSTPLSGQVDK
ncbi:TOX high mobility group box family member 3 [Diaphorina citri]|jgi:Chromatin-associated proteins containing the HMG domain|uniref:TOX high mobility group box family member 3 n=1 Tax=Diaphorina citri TaxID=121845 RepID=A0A3Q0IYF5_DIACI|nr:TOX high mobility group box family member 3 [Diaphorina citri]